ncbi:hypothetical protein FB451DRAFT_1195786 [Mycena latifolia]|nr:hypothetical protein FB451DRAFT_1195786 [Mycena latifolia]
MSDQNPPEPNPSSASPIRKRVYLACLNCRKRKIRCIKAGESEPCERCVRRGLQCEYLAVCATVPQALPPTPGRDGPTADPFQSATTGPYTHDSRIQPPQPPFGYNASGRGPYPPASTAHTGPSTSQYDHANPMSSGYQPFSSTDHRYNYSSPSQYPVPVHHQGYNPAATAARPSGSYYYPIIPPTQRPGPDFQAYHVDSGQMYPHPGLSDPNTDSR